MEAKIFERNDYTEEEYFELFDQFERKIEYHNGQIEMMAGASSAHNDIAVNLLLALARNSKNCKPHNSDQAVSIPLFKRYVYPDLSFSCGGPEYKDGKGIVLLNPTLVVEVVSGSSDLRDRKDKFEWYFSIPSVQEYIIVDSTKIDVKSYLRKSKKDWAMQSLWSEEQVLIISSLGEEISLKEIYNDVVLASAEEDI
jgi:Uma2 family endonuclease